MMHILLPCYNEALNLVGEIMGIDRACRAAGLEYSITVVDDGSVDETAAVAADLARRYPVTIVPHPVNRGLAAAMRTGILHLVARARPDECVVTKDADNSHPSDILPIFVARLYEGYDLIIASRYREGAAEIGLTPHRRLLSRGASVLFQVACPIPGVRDFTCGYRAFRASLLQRAVDHFEPHGGLIEARGFACTAELLLKLARITDRIIEVPFVLRYDLKAGPSKMQIWRTARENLSIARRVRRLPMGEA